MRNKVTIFSMILLFAIYACKESNIQEDNSVNIHVRYNTNNINIGDYLQYDSYIVLETTEDCLISQVDRIEFFNQRIYILDSKVATIFIFDYKGKFLNKIDKKGSGEGEYIGIEDFVIDTKRNMIYLLDRIAGNIMQYDFSGNFFNKVNIETGYTFLTLRNQDWLIYLGNGSSRMSDLYNLKLYNTDGQLINKFLPFNRALAGITYSVSTTKSIFYKYDNELYILPLLSNIIYIYNEETNQLHVKYKINFPEGTNDNINENSTEADVKNFRAKLYTGEISSDIHNFYKIKDLIFFQFFYQKKRFFCLFNETLDQIESSEKRLFDENGLFFEPIRYFSDKEEDKVLSILQGGQFNTCKEITKDNNSSVINEIDKSIGMEEDPNPILIWYSLKK